MFPEIISVKPMSDYKIWLNYSDGTEGAIDLSHLAGKNIFRFWDLDNNFLKVFIHPDSGAVAWNDEIDLCPDSLFLELKGTTYEDWKVNNSAYATH